MSERNARVQRWVLVIVTACFGVAVFMVSALVFALSAFATFFMGAADRAAIFMLLALGGLAFAAFFNVRVLRPMIRSLDHYG